tara:strand:+ start:290 stop:673 length:384 start_codon:yes stop_codon:yes gene_type:complete
LKIFGKINKGKIVWDNKTKLIEGLKNFNEGADVVVEIREAETARTTNQNKLWWKWMQILGDFWGLSRNEAHDLCKVKFLKQEIMINGEKIDKLQSTTTLTKSEFNLLMCDVLFWANDTFQVNLPSSE